MRTPVVLVIALALVAPVSSSRRQDVRRRVPSVVSTTEDIPAAARSSPLFRGEFDASQLSRQGLTTISLQPGVDLDFARYLDGSRLRSRPEFEPLFQNAVGQRFLERAPVHVENILRLDDRLVVERNLKVTLRPGVCQAGALPASVAGLCLKPKKGVLPADVRNGLAEVRRKLQAGPGTRLVRGRTTADAARRMSDAELLDLVFNQGDKEISHVSVIPLQACRLPPGAPLTELRAGALDDFRVKLPMPLWRAPSAGRAPTAVVPRSRTAFVDFGTPEEIYDSLSPEAAWEFGSCMAEVELGFKGDGSRAAEWDREFDALMVKGAVAGNFSYSVARTWTEAIPLLLRIQGGQRNCTRRAIDRGERRAAEARERRERRPVSFDERYFLTGDSVVRRISDDFRVTFAGETWFTDEYYAKLSYYIDVSYGIRLAFGLQVAAAPMVVSGNGARGRRSRPVTITAEPLNAGANPVYRAVGLPADKHLDGNEFYFSVGAGCKFYASIPGPNISPGWVRVGLPAVRGDFTPSVGDTAATMANVWLEGDDTGLGIGGGIGGAYLDVGLAGKMEQGRILYRVKADGNAVLQGGNSQQVSVDRLTRTSRNPGKERTFHLSPQDIDLPMWLAIDDPRYAFTLAIVPQLRARLNLDLGIFDWNHTFGPFTFDGLAIRQGFELDGHPGTRTSQKFMMY